MFRSRNGKTRDADFTVGDNAAAVMKQSRPESAVAHKIPAVKASGAYAGEKPCFIFAAHRSRGDFACIFSFFT